MRKILFLTGSRADFGKLKPLVQAVRNSGNFEPQFFVTGMHMLERYGSTWEQVASSGLASIFPYANQSAGDPMDAVLAKTILGLSEFVSERNPDLLVVHGDRVEALAGAIVGALNNIRVAHVEGGELSGTVDEVLRHAISKLSYWHFVSNEESKERLLQLGETTHQVSVIGSPDIDVMNSPDLPLLMDALEHYGLRLDIYGVLLFHPVTTEIDQIEPQTRATMEALADSGFHMVVIEPNNDWGSDLIRGVYEDYRDHPRFFFFPSMRFEFFLTILRHSRFVIGNSSAGVREAPHYGVPAINLGSRQRNRVQSELVINTEPTVPDILSALEKLDSSSRKPESNFGDGRSAERFLKIIEKDEFWSQPMQKQFVDRPLKKRAPKNE